MPLRRPALTSICLSLLLTSFAHALDLAEAYAMARENDPSWQAARHTYLAEQQEKAIARGGLLPGVGASGSVSQEEFEPADASIPPRDYDATQWAVRATQPLFNAGAWFNYQRARASSSQAEANFRSEEQELALRVSQAYFSVLSAQETLAYAESEEAAFGRQLDQAQQRFDVGLIAITDVLEARAAFDGARANRIAADAALSSTRENLAALIGEVPGRLVPISADAPMLKPVPSDPEAWVLLAREHNPDLIAARYGYDAARAISRQARAGYLPTVDLYASYANSDLDTDNPFLSQQSGTSKSVGIEARWALLAGGSTYATSRQASFRAAAAQDIATGVERQIVATARTAYMNVAADAYRVDARKQAVASSEASLEATQAGYEVGTRNIVDVLLAQRNMYAAKRDYAAARYDYVINSLRLKAASGQLGATDIRELNRWLDPSASVMSAPDQPADLPVTPVAPPAPQR